MKTFESLSVTTHVDRHGDVFTKEALEDMARQANDVFVPITVEHDPRYPPIGRMRGAIVRQLDDGAFGLYSILEFFEPGDDPVLDESLEMDPHLIPPDGFTILRDRSHMSEEDLSSFDELAQNESITVVQQTKKSLEPISALILGIGAGIAASFASGFFNQMGVDTWNALKRGLADILARRRQSGSEFLFILQVQLERQGHYLTVECILTSPTQDDLDEFWSNGVQLVGQLCAGLDVDNDVRRVVVHYEHGELRPAYALRKDCVALELNIHRSTGWN